MRAHNTAGMFRRGDIVYLGKRPMQFMHYCDALGAIKIQDNAGVEWTVKRSDVISYDERSKQIIADREARKRKLEQEWIDKITPLDDGTRNYREIGGILGCWSSTISKYIRIRKERTK